MTAIRELAAGRTLLDPVITGPLSDRLHRGGHRDLCLDSLTERERRVLALITEGLTNRQIGDEMFLAEKTVKNHVSSLLSKLSMVRRTQSAGYGVGNRPPE